MLRFQSELGHRQEHSVHSGWQKCVQFTITRQGGAAGAEEVKEANKMNSFSLSLFLSHFFNVFKTETLITNFPSPIIHCCHKPLCYIKLSLQLHTDHSLKLQLSL